MPSYSFILYITGQTAQTTHAIHSLRQFCEEYLTDDYELTIVNVLESPNLAEIDNVLATPTLIRVLPKPHCRIIGDLADTNKVMSILGLDNVRKKRD